MPKSNDPRGRDGLWRPSVLALILANLVPAVGVVALGWEVLPLLLLFWMENVVVGLFHVARMLAASPSQPGTWIMKILMIPFFCFHYGMFTTVHGILLLAVFGGMAHFGRSMPSLPELVAWVVTSQKLGWGALALVLSHAVSFVTNYLGRGEYRRVNVKELMMQPYERVMVLHVTILAGAFLATALHARSLMLLPLVGLKIVIDVASHMRERRKWAGEAQDAPRRTEAKSAAPRSDQSGTEGRSAA